MQVCTQPLHLLPAYHQLPPGSEQRAYSMPGDHYPSMQGSLAALPTAALRVPGHSWVPALAPLAQTLPRRETTGQLVHRVVVQTRPGGAVMVAPTPVLEGHPLPLPPRQGFVAMPAPGARVLPAGASFVEPPPLLRAGSPLPAQASFVAPPPAEQWLPASGSWLVPPAPAQRGPLPLRVGVAGSVPAAQVRSLTCIAPYAHATRQPAAQVRSLTCIASAVAADARPMQQTVQYQPALQLRPQPVLPQQRQAPQLWRELPSSVPPQLPAASLLAEAKHSVATPPLAATFLTTTSVSPAPRAQESRQESDLLETVTKVQDPCDPATRHIRLVSLGCYCGPKLSFQKMGRGAETLPFDWLRVRMEGLFDFLHADFQGFFEYGTKLLPEEGGGGMTIYRGKHHAFWHDNPTDAGMRERYQRRIARFKEINASSQRGGEPVLFVRVAGHTGELAQVPGLLAELKTRFGDLTRLLVIVNFQRQNIGPSLVQGLDDLMIWFLHEDAHRRTSPHFSHPYKEAAQVALDWIIGRPLQAPLNTFENMDRLAAMVTVNKWGESGLMNLPAFEAPLPVAGCWR